MDAIRALLSKIKTLFSIVKKGRGAPPPPLPALFLSLLVARLWVWLNMHQYPWICLKILENAWINCFMPGLEYALSSDMYARLLKMHLVLNKPGLWIWHGFICKGESDFCICLIMALYASIMPEYALMSLDMPEHDWILSNVSEYA